MTSPTRRHAAARVLAPVCAMAWCCVGAGAAATASTSATGVQSVRAAAAAADVTDAAQPVRSESASASVAVAATHVWHERPDWARHFDAAGVEGTIAVHDTRTGQRFAHDAARAAQRFLPASTFKVAHALFALDAGVVRDEFQVFAWDGVERSIPAWNRDQTLRSAMRHSVVWVFQGFARAIGEAGERAYLQRAGYGNADPGGGIDRFWLAGGALRISPIEQVIFLERLYRNALPFEVAHQRLVKDVMIVEAGRDWILRGKTGWSGDGLSPQVGWWTGWVERPEGAVIFALEIALEGTPAELAAREGVARAVLQSMDALPR